MKNIDSIATDLFDKIRSRFERVNIGDEGAQTTQDPEKARFFNFDYVAKDGNKFGNVTISIINNKDLKIYFGKNITDNLNDVQKQEWYSFLRNIRMFAKRHMMTFDTRDISRNNLEVNDVLQMAAGDSTYNKNDVKESKTKKKFTARDFKPFILENEQALAISLAERYQKLNNGNHYATHLRGPGKWTVHSKQITESKLYGKGRDRTKSYQDIGKTTPVKLVLKHNTPVDETVQGSRARHIESVFVETAEGERFKLPFTNLAGARAMGQHISHGGQVHDDIGDHIGHLVTKMQAMRKFVRAAKNKTFESEDAGAMVESAIAEYTETHTTLSRIKGPKGYKNFKETFEPNQDTDVNVEELKEKFSRKVFDGRLEEALPFVYRAHAKRSGMVQEVAPISPITPTYPNKDSTKKQQQQPKKEFKVKEADEYEEFMGQIADGDNVNPADEDTLKELLSNDSLPVGVDGINVTPIIDQYLTAADTSELIDAVYSLSQIDPDSDAAPVIVSWLEENDPELLGRLGLGADREKTEPNQQKTHSQQETIEFLGGKKNILGIKI